MGLIQYEQLEDGFDASANLWNERFGVIFNEINGNLDSANLKNGAVTEPKLADGSVTSRKLGFEKYIDDNGWLITDLGLVKLATKKRGFTIPSRAQGTGGYVTLDAGSELNPVGFNENSAYNVMMQPYMVGVPNAATGDWVLIPKEQESNEPLKPNSQVSAKRISGGTSVANQAGVAETWVVF